VSRGFFLDLTFAVGVGPVADGDLLAQLQPDQG